MAARRRSLGMAAAAAAAAVSLAACGSSATKAAGGAPVAHAGDGAVLTTAYDEAVAAKSARMTLSATVTTPAQTVTTSGSGIFDWGRRLGQLTFTIPLQAQSTSITAVLDATTVYVQVPGAARSAVGGKPWLKFDISGLGSSGSDDPAQTLAVLEASSTSTQDLGPATVGGVATTHYQAQVDPAKAAAKASPAAQKLIAQLPALTGGATFPVDVWVDAHGLPRQLGYVITIQKAPAGSATAAAQAFPETVRVTMGLSDYGTPVTVTVPPADQVSTQSLPGLTGGSASS